ncbi:hypothetical protein [Legionella cardiaca]|uniref:Uncharacterized protein n=1 Tax=Legionella cardiaca TaxID=1071983 RepID=A0ABY8AT22_9GAMM|nr:hypothetical protein [Legionella cardiaca]WED42312.1 hypothetical protein PXX05_10270 [Legionella cardiaca]
MPTRRLGITLGTVAAAVGAYAVYDSNQSAYQPRINDYLKASYVVATGIAVYQPPPVVWTKENRKVLDASAPRAEVAGVNRALEAYGVDLRDEELALLLAQGGMEMNSFNPGPDLAAERLISRSFGDEYTELMEDAAKKPEPDEESLEQIRKQAAAAKVGELAHFAYGAIKATWSYGAITEDDLGSGTYNEHMAEMHSDEVEERAREQSALLAAKSGASMTTIKAMKQALCEMRQEHSTTPEDEPPRPPQLV